MTESSAVPRRHRTLAAGLLAALAVPLVPATAATAAEPADIGVTVAADATDLPGKGTTRLTVTVTNHGDAWTDIMPVAHVRGTAAESRLIATDDRCVSRDTWRSAWAFGSLGMVCRDLDQLAPGGSVSWTLDYEADPVGGDDALTVTTEFGPDATPDDDRDSITLHVEPYVNEADSWTSLSPISSIQRPGERTWNEVHYGSAGPENAERGHLTVTSSEPTTFAAESTPIGVSCTGGATLDCDLGVVWIGDPAKIVFWTTAPDREPGQSAPLTLTSTITTDARDPDATNNTQAADMQVAAQASGDLGVAVSTSVPTRQPGELTTWFVDATNAGPNTVDATVTVSVPAAAGPLSADGGATATRTTDGHTVYTWQVPYFAANQPRAFHVTTQAVTPGTYRLTANITAAGDATDPNTANNTDTSAPLEVIRTADLGVAAAGPGPRQFAGVPGTWSVAITNLGKQATTAVVTVMFPAGLKPTTPAGATATAGPNGSTVLTWPSLSLAAGQVATQRVSATPTATGTYRMSAEVAPATGAPADLNTANNAHISPTLTADLVGRIVTVTTVSSGQWSDRLRVDVAVTAANGVSTSGTPVTVRAFGRTHTVKVGSDGTGRIDVSIVSAPGTRTTVIASVAASGFYKGASGSSRTITVGKEDGKLQWGSVSVGYRQPTTVNLQMLDPTAKSYSGTRDEGYTTATRGDVRKGMVTVKVYYGRTLIGTYNRTLGDMGNGMGQTSITFTPTKRGTYTLVATHQSGSYYSGSTLNGTVSVR